MSNRSQWPCRTDQSAPIDSPGWEPQNRLLSALAGRDLLSLQPHLEAVPLARGRVLFGIDEPLTRLYFVETGIVALLTTLKSRTMGVAAVGREGAVDIQSLLLGGGSTLGRCEVLVPGSALAVEVSAFRSALCKSPKLRVACKAFARAMFVQILQAVSCNRLHSAEQRCARSVLMSADRMADDTVELAMDGLAQMLGLPQPTTTIVVRRLQNDGLICSRRSAITVVDRPGLEMAACECYRIVRNHCRRLLAHAFD
jgi:CRP-like cAMP-binding protein